MIATQRHHADRLVARCRRRRTPVGLRPRDQGSVRKVAHGLTIPTAGGVARPGQPSLPGFRGPCYTGPLNRRSGSSGRVRICESARAIDAAAPKDSRYIDRDPRGGAMKAGTKTRLGAAIALAAIWSGAFVPTALSQEETTGSAPDEKVTFTVGQVNDAITFNPMFAIETPEYNTMDMAYDTFLTWDLDGMGTAPGLAESWEQSEDGLTWTFKVKEGVTWSDGTPFTAHDVAATYNWILDQGVGQLHRLPALHRFDHRAGRHDARLDDHAADRRPAVPAVHLHPAGARPRPVQGQGRLPDVEGLPGHDRHRPVRARRMAARRFLANGGQPRLLARRSEDRRAGVPRLPERRGDDPGPRARRDRLRVRRSRAPICSIPCRAVPMSRRRSPHPTTSSR